MTSEKNDRKPAERASDMTTDAARFLNTLPLMLRVSAPDGSDVWFNECWLNFTGRTLPAERRGEWRHAVHPDDLDQILPLRSPRPNPGQQMHLRFRMRRKDGEYRRMACTGTPRFAANGEFLGLIYSCMDIQDLYTDEEYSDLELLLARATAQLSEERSRTALAAADAELGRAGEYRANQAKTQTERQFRQLVQGITDYAIFLLDPDGRVSTWNPGAERIKGYKADEIIGRHFSQFYTEEDRVAGVPEMALSTAKRQGRFETESWRVRKDGTRFWANVVIDAIRDENGRLVGFAKITRDLTERRAAENESRQFKLLLSGVTDYAIFLLDPKGNVATWNPGAQRIKGYSAEEIIGKHFSTFYTEEDRASGLPDRILATAAREGKFETEAWRVRKDGTRFWASVVIDAIRNDTGELVGFAKITRDLSERKAAETESSQLRLLIQGVKDYAVFLLDRDGKVSTWNPGAERIKGYTAEEILGRHIGVFYTEEDRAAGLPQQALETAARDGRFETENWRVRKDGSRFWANVVIDAIHDEDGNLAGFAKITRDLSERKAAQEELNKAREQLFQLQKMEAIGQLTGGVAHDFNNLLTIIIGNVDMAHRALADGKPGAADKARRLLGNALAGAKRAANLTQRLLAFARRQPLDPKPIDVTRFMNSVGEFLTRTLGEQIHVETVTGGSLWKIEADPTQLESAILNIALNARDAMPEGGKLTIEAANAYLDASYVRVNPEISPGQYVTISITDTGTGMTPEVMAHVFEPFFTTKGLGQGTGLGLAQVYGFVRQSGGNVKVYSEPGEGTMVKIYLPRLLAKKDEEELVTPETVYGAGGETILVVEDDPAVLEYVSEVLKDLNYRVLEAPEGAAAVKILQSDSASIDLLLTDVIMPGMSGRVVAEEARRLKPGIKILFMTGYSQNAIVHQGRLDQGVHLIQKPVTPPVLASRVRDLLDQVESQSQPA